MYTCAFVARRRADTVTNVRYLTGIWFRRKWRHAEVSLIDNEIKLRVPVNFVRSREKWKRTTGSGVICSPAYYFGAVI